MFRALIWLMLLVIPASAGAQVIETQNFSIVRVALENRAQLPRDGSIVVPSSAPLVIIEGVGVSRRSLGPLIDAAVWVQSDWDEANRRGIARDGGGQAETDFWWEWDAEEQPFLADDRPWQRADVVICGTPAVTEIDHDPETELLVGRSLRP